MPYVAKLFLEVTGKDLQGLSQFTGWIGLGGYYHWRVAQQGLLHLVPHLQDQLMPRTPNAHPSGQPLPQMTARTETPAAGASAKRQGRAQPAPEGSGEGPTSSQGGKSTTPNQGGKSSTPCQSVNWPLQVEVGHQPPWEVLSTLPQVEEERVIVPGLTGTK